MPHQVLREMLVAPVSRTSAVLGKALGGSTIAMLQGPACLRLRPSDVLPERSTLPLRNVPGWLAFLNKLDPVSYGVDPLRQAVMSGMQ